MAERKKYILMTQHQREPQPRRHIMRLHTDEKARGVAALRVKISQSSARRGSEKAGPIISWTLYAQVIDNDGKKLHIIDASEFAGSPVEVDPKKIKRATERFSRRRQRVIP